MVVPDHAPDLRFAGKLAVLESMVDELMTPLRAQLLAWEDWISVAPVSTQPPSATVGQPLTCVS